MQSPRNLWWTPEGHQFAPHGKFPHLKQFGTLHQQVISTRYWFAFLRTAWVGMGKCQTQRRCRKAPPRTWSHGAGQRRTPQRRSQTSDLPLNNKRCPTLRSCRRLQTNGTCASGAAEELRLGSEWRRCLMSAAEEETRNLLGCFVSVMRATTQRNGLKKSRWMRKQANEERGFPHLRNNFEELMLKYFRYCAN